MEGLFINTHFWLDLIGRVIAWVTKAKVLNLCSSCPEKVQGFERKSFIVTEDVDMTLRLEGYEDGDSPMEFEDRPVVEIWIAPIVSSMDVATEARDLALVSIAWATCMLQVLSIMMDQQQNWSFALSTYQ